MLRRIVIPVLFVCLALALCDLLAAQDTAPSANSDARYQAVRNPSIGQSFEVNTLVLKRDVGTFTLISGTLCLLQPVEGMVTGAVFRGSGTFSLTADTPYEQRQIKLLTKGRELLEAFSDLGLRFADGTGDEIKNSSSVKPSSAGCPVDILEHFNHELRKELKSNVASRLLQPVLAHKPDGFFMAFIKGNIFSNRMIFEIDPFDEEEVSLFSYQDTRYGAWYGGRLHQKSSQEPEAAHHHGFVTPASYKLNTTIEKSGYLTGEASVTFAANADSLWVVPLDLHSTLRVSKVTDAGGNPLAWIQEDKNEDAGYVVILPKQLARGESFTITTTYGGKDVVQREGSGNYYPLARTAWYPNAGMMRYADYDMTFHTPKGNLIAATGALVSSNNNGGQLDTVWKSEGPITVAGFNFGDFKTETVKLDKINTTVQAFVNREPPESPDALLRRSLQGVVNPGQYVYIEGLPPLGTLNTTPLLKRALAESQLAMQIYTDYFGPIPLKNIHVTQQSAWNYGQAWPDLVFLPLTYFLDTTQRHALGYDETDPYFRVVAPHEVSHQWWGHTVAWRSYRDQWLSEGFADFSASIYLQAVYPKPDEYLNFWRDQRQMLLERDKEGFRPIDVGPLIMGTRLDTSRAGAGNYRRLIYGKGSFVLHMLRMLMYNAQNDGDARFKAMMHDYVKTYTGRAASTEDFQRIAEKYMPPGMDLDSNHRLDWFFEDWVYGTQLPDYSVSSQFLRDGENVLMDLSLTQRNVDDSFRNAMPIYLELADGRIVRLGTLGIKGNQTTKQRVPLGKMKDLPRRALINANFDTLCTIDGK